MPRACTICRHPSRQAIDQALAAREPYRQIAARFGTSPAALHPHQQAHTPRPPVAPLPGGAPAQHEAAQRVHAAAVQLQRQIVDIRSLHDPELLWRVHDIATMLVDVTGLLVARSGR